MAGLNASSTAPQGQAEGRYGKGFGLMGMGNPRAAGAWEPTVSYLLILVVVELVAYGYLRYAFRGTHGG